MAQRKLPVALLGMLVTLLAVACTEGTQDRFRAGPDVTVPSGDAIAHDLYLSAGTVRMLGEVTGDVIASGGSIDIGGTVDGDVAAAGGSITIGGPVTDDVRVAGGSISVRGDVGDDLLAAGGSVRLEPGATVGGHFLTGAGSTNLDGTVEGDFNSGSGEVNIQGVVNGNVYVRTDHLTLHPDARIGGDLHYVSAREADIMSGAEVGGTVAHEIPTTRVLGIEMQEGPLATVLSAIVSQVQWFLGILLVGLLLLWLVPRPYLTARRTLRDSPWLSLGSGLAVLVLAPLVVALAAAIAILLGGIAGSPVLVVPAAIYVALLALAAPVAALVLGDLILEVVFKGRNPTPWKSLLLGAVVLALIGFIPWVGGVVSVVVLLFGFGTWVLAGFRLLAAGRRREPAGAAETG